MVKKHPKSHVFIDELAVHSLSLSSEQIAQLSNCVGEKNYLWIACQKNKVPGEDDQTRKILEGNLLKTYPAVVAWSGLITELSLSWWIYPPLGHAYKMVPVDPQCYLRPECVLYVCVS